MAHLLNCVTFAASKEEECMSKWFVASELFDNYFFKEYT